MLDATLKTLKRTIQDVEAKRSICLLHGMTNAAKKAKEESSISLIKDVAVGQAETQSENDDNTNPAVGCTVFLFNEGMTFVTSKLGGSIASYCTDEVDLFDDTKVEILNKVNAVFFSGGSNHGLSVGGGVAEWLIEKAMASRKGSDSDEMFDIPRVSGAITFAGAWGSNQAWKPPTSKLGFLACEAAQHNWSPEKLPKGHAGAGHSCYCGTINGVMEGYPGGQGCAADRLGGKIECFAYVVLNCVGDIVQSPDYKGKQPPEGNRYQSSNVLVHTNVKFASIQHMQQVAKQIHCGMAAEIVPFACCGDGDILFLSSNDQVELDNSVSTAQLGLFFSSVIRKAIGSVF